MIYFDYAATTPLDPDAAQIYVKTATEYYGNSNSLHDIGSESADLLENCRSELAKLLGVDRHGLFFTSGGSEGNFLAIAALLSAPKKAGNHIITSLAEHSSIHGVMQRLEKMGYEITYLPYNQSGLIDTDELSAALKPETVLVTIQHVNPEIGTIQPIKKMAEICKQHDILFHSDFVQSFGKIELKTIAPLVNSFSFSGHKIYGPKGIGGVYLNPGLCFQPLFPGTTQERGLRPGTVNVPAIAAMTVAAEKIVGQIPANLEKAQVLREAFIEEVKPIQEWVTIHQASGTSQLPSIIGLRISGMEGQWLMLECNRRGFAISTGSACHAGRQVPANTMQALGIGNSEAKEFTRISFGKSTAVEEVQRLGETITNIVKKFKPAKV